MSTTSLINIQKHDQNMYEEKIKPILPETIIDVHTHVWLREFSKKQSQNLERTVSWPSMVAKDSPIKELEETFQCLFPDNKTIPFIFTSVQPGDDLENANAYVSKACQNHEAYPLLWTVPEWDQKTLEAKIINGNFYGIKMYLSFAPAHLSKNEIRIFDYLPHHHLEVVDQYHGIVMLHIPRDGRLGDPTNIQDLMTIEKTYKNLQLIVAHVGRAYCVEDAGNAFDILKNTQRMYIDFSANTNAEIFYRLLSAIDPKRILFGSDLPITRMRMRRICENGMYINIVPKGLYGDVTKDPHMREVTGTEADQLTFFLYEEILSFINAVERHALPSEIYESIFYSNARRLIETAEKGGLGQKNYESNTFIS